MKTNQVATIVPCKGRRMRGSVMVITLVTVVVLTVLALSILTLSSSENFDMRRERREMMAFYAAEAGVHEALARLRLDPSSFGNESTSKSPLDPDSVRDPLLIVHNTAGKTCSPEPNPGNKSDSTTIRYWNFDPAWSYTDSTSTGAGNAPGSSPYASSLDSAGRGFSYTGAHGTLPSPSATNSRSTSSYDVRVVSHVRRFATGWGFADEMGSAAAENNYYYKVLSTGINSTSSDTYRYRAEVVVKKFCFGSAVPAALTAGGNVVVKGNGSVSSGDIASGMAVQSAGGSITTSGGGEISGATATGTAFPGFNKIFGQSIDEMRPPVPSSGVYPSIVPDSSILIEGQHCDQQLTGTPGGTTTPLVWFKSCTPSGNVSFSSGTKIGSPEHPVVMIVEGNLTLNTVEFYGVIYVTGTFDNQGDSMIRGAVLVEGTALTDIEGTGTGYKIAYSQSVVDNLNNTRYAPRPVKGSWKMRRITS